MENYKEEIDRKLEQLSRQLSNLLKVFIIFPIIFIVLSVIQISSGFKYAYDSAPTIHYNNSTRILKPIKMYHITFVPTTGNGGSYNISSLGMTEVLNVQAITLRNTATAGDIPAISIKSISTTAITYNIVQANPSTITILGINVLSGSPQAFPTTLSDITIKMTIIGY
jgi:hypothetical protein